LGYGGKSLFVLCLIDLRVAFYRCPNALRTHETFIFAAHIPLLLSSSMGYWMVTPPPLSLEVDTILFFDFPSSMTQLDNIEESSNSTVSP
jgi:hypothetical protein